MALKETPIRPKKSTVQLMFNTHDPLEEIHHGNALISRKRPMNKLVLSTHPRESSTHERAIEDLARQSHVSIDQVAQLYERELAALKIGARVTGFLTILTTRKVREILRTLVTDSTLTL